MNMIIVYLFSLPHIKQEIPGLLIFKALGCLSDKEIIYFIIDNNGSEIDKMMIKILKNSLIDISQYRSEYDAIKYMSKYVNNNNSFSVDMKINYCSNIIKKNIYHILMIHYQNYISLV